MSDRDPCPVCSLVPTKVESGSDSLAVDCLNCGRFVISGSALASLPGLIGGSAAKAALVGLALRRMQRSEKQPRLTADAVQTIVQTEELPAPDVQADNLVRWLGDNVPQGQVGTVAVSTHSAVIGATNAGALFVILNGLLGAGLIRWNPTHGQRQHVQLGYEGWKRYKELKAEATAATGHHLAAVLFTDIAGYTTLMAANEEAALAARESSMAALKRLVDRHHGRLVKTIGDGTVSEFLSAVNAIRAALDIQSATAQQNVDRSEESRLMLRMGIAVGDVTTPDGDILGDVVNLAARLENKAASGTICIPEHVRDDVANKLDLICDDLGPQQLKGIARPVRIVQVRPPPL